MAREDWWRGECEEMEELDKRGRSDLMYCKVKQTTRTGKSGTESSSTIKDRSGVLLTEPEEVKSRWREYIEELYCASEKPKFDEMGIEAEGSVEEDNKRPELLGDEIRAAIKEIKKGKAVGVNEMLAEAEFFKIIGEEA